MNKKLILSLLSSSTIFASLMSTVAIVNPAHAAQRLIHTKDGRSCITHPHGGTTFVCIRVSQANQASRPKPGETLSSMQPSDSNIAMLDFTEEESDAAIKLFTCDCPYCLNSLRQLRGTGNLVY